MFLQEDAKFHSDQHQQTGREAKAAREAAARAEGQHYARSEERDELAVLRATSAFQLAKVEPNQPTPISLL
jgi:hypothetical protein